MAAVLDYSRCPPLKNLILFLTRELNLIERKTQWLFLGLVLSSLMKLFFKIPRWPTSWIVKMAATEKPNFAYKSRTKHYRKTDTKAIPRFWGQRVQ